MTETPTEKEFRDAGYTYDAINYPLSDAALARLCKFNGITPERAPRAWRYAPNAYVRDYWELRTLAPDDGKEPHMNQKIPERTE